MRPKGFVIPDGYMGLMPNGRYQRFDTEGEYLDYIKEDNSDDKRRDNSNEGTKREDSEQ